VGTGPRLDGADPFRVEDTGSTEHPGVLVGVDVGGHHHQGQNVRELAAQQRDQRRVAGADGSGDADPQAWV
jgi:hypothetical protein